MRKGTEECDDGNVDNEDGCSSECTVEAGNSCGGAYAYAECGGPGDRCEAGCGNGIKSALEECDDGNDANSDGCSSSCQIECGWNCSSTVEGDPQTCLPTPCGDGKVSGLETCDDGKEPQNFDGCSASCSVEFGWICTHSLECSTADECTEICGDGIRVGREMDGGCDDGNKIDGDGCSHECTAECGFACGDTCVSLCGDGLRATQEECDDGNTVDGDGCSSSCEFELGFSCSRVSSEEECGQDQCLEIAGDGLRVGVEVCDDGNDFDGDGCSNGNLECGFVQHDGDSWHESFLGTICGDGLLAGVWCACA
jgi:cysteine-rich repeat protein